MMDIVESVKELCEGSAFMGDTVTPMSVLKSCVEPYQLMEIICMKAQRDFCKSLEELEKDIGTGKCFRVDKWDKDSDPNVYSGGVTCVLEGDVFEKAGVNVSSVCGTLSPAAMKQMCSRLPPDVDCNSGLPFRAVGISSVIHPMNPFAPTMHFNFRYFQIQLDKNVNSKYVWWFGGGADLTPHYYFKEDAQHFHGVFKECCDLFSDDYYGQFKKWCDEYFFIAHRNEHRGIGGIFFDDLNTPSFNECLSFVKTCALSIPRCYTPIVKKRANTPYNDEHKDWQLIRRGRYVEFNLIYDRGTKFGLCVPGSRVESILMSLPKHATWLYCHTPKEGTPEYETLQILTNPIDYI